jgi:hypothetical protein
MSKDKQYIQSMLSDVNGSISHKRVITFMGFGLLALAFLVNVFFEIAIQEFIYNGMIYVVAGGMGFSVAEYFGNVRKSKNEEEPKEEELNEGITEIVGNFNEIFKKEK